MGDIGFGKRRESPGSSIGSDGSSIVVTVEVAAAAALVAAAATKRELW